MAEKATNYVSIAHPRPASNDLKAETSGDHSPSDVNGSHDESGPPAFSLPKFIPLLAERIYTLNAFTRMFLVNWINLLDSIPDLELISHLPAFLKGLLQFLSDPNDDVRAATQQVLTGFLQDIRKAADVKKSLNRRRKLGAAIEESDSASGNSKNAEVQDDAISPAGGITIAERLPEDNYDEIDDGVPGQDVRMDYAKVISILIPCLSDSGFLALPNER